MERYRIKARFPQGLYEYYPREYSSFAEDFIVYGSFIGSFHI